MGLQPYTPLRIALPLIAGIVCAIKLQIRSDLLYWFIALFFLYAGFIFFIGFRLVEYTSRWIAGIMANICLFLLGVIMTGFIGYETAHNDRYNPHIPEGALMICEIAESPHSHTYGFSVKGYIRGYEDSAGNWRSAATKVLVNIRADSAGSVPFFGDGLLLQGDCRTVPGPMNPDAFDYRRYLQNRRINWQVNADHFQIIPKSFAAGKPLLIWAHQSRDHIRKTLEACGLAGDELALAAALLLGTKDLLSREISTEFSNAGAMHVLCVSGLHVGIMYVIAERLLFFLGKGRKSRNTRQILAVLFIWVFALVTGLASSVLRAALMFSLIALGKMMRSSTINFNILATAAFIQLCINPYDLTQVGFQLSYLAVAGIFAFYKPIGALVRNVNKPAGWAWSVMSVSIAAQLATSPLACHYFNLFPVYFLLTNLAVVPLAGIIIYFSLGLLTFAAFGLTAPWLSLPLQWSLRLMHFSVETVQSIPGAVISSLVLSATEVVLIYIMIAGVYIFWVLKNRRAVVLVGISLILLLISMNVQTYHRKTKSEIIVYYVPGVSAIDLIHNRKVICLCDSVPEADSLKISSRAGPHRMHSRAEEILNICSSNKTPETELTNAWISGLFSQFRGKSLVLVRGLNGWKAPAEPLELDLVILSGRQRFDPARLKQYFNFRQLVIDGSVPGYLDRMVQEYFEAAGISCHSVRRQGAFSMKW